MSKRDPNKPVPDFDQRWISHLRAKTFACQICPDRPTFKSKKHGEIHLRENHQELFPTTTDAEVEMFLINSLSKPNSNIDNGPSRSAKRHAETSSVGWAKGPGDQESSRRISHIGSQIVDGHSPHANVPQFNSGQGRPSLRESSGKAARKKRATGLEGSPNSSVRTTPSEVDIDERIQDESSTTVHPAKKLRSPPAGRSNDDRDFVPRDKASTGHLYNPQSPSTYSQLRRIATPSSQSKQLGHPSDTFASAAQNSPRNAGTGNMPLWPGADSPQNSTKAPGQRSMFPVSALNQSVHTVSSGSKPIHSATISITDSQMQDASTQMKLRHEEPSDDPRLILQPVTRPISQDQLIAEVKGIYAGLVMVEGKCIQVDAKQTQLVKDAPIGQPPKLNNEQYQALIALHRTLLHEHHDFFLASQHPSATPGVRRLALKYAMPARLWKHGIHAFLELLRNRLPDSIEHMLAFIYLAYSMMTLLLETVPAFESTWIECLGDLARYRMAIVEKGPDDECDSDKENSADESDAGEVKAIHERNEKRRRDGDSLSSADAKARKLRKKRRAFNDQERDTWTQVAFEWYVKSSNSSPEVGRLCHHLAILSQADECQQLFFYGKALVVPKPFEAARESILTLFRPVFGQRKWRRGALKVDKSFTTMHAVMFTRTELQRFDQELPAFIRRIDRYIGSKAEVFLESTGYHMAISNIQALVDYGKFSNPIVRALLDTSIPVADTEMSDTTTTEHDHIVFNMARRLFDQTALAVFSRANDKYTLSFLHCTLVFIHRISLSPAAMETLEISFPWQRLATVLNSLLQSYSAYDRILGDSIPMPPVPGALPFREDFALREIFWANRYYPEGWFDKKHIDREDQFRDNAALVDTYRPERLLWLGAQIAKRVSSLQYNPVEHRFLAPIRRNRLSRPDLEYPNEQESVTLAGDTDDISMVSVVST